MWPAEAVSDEGLEGRRIAGLTCAEVADLLPTIVDGPSGRRRTDRRVARHLDQCLRCQAEISGYRRLLKALHALRTEILEPPGGAVTSVLAGLAADSERRARHALLHGHRALYLGGVGVAAAAVLLVALASSGLRAAPPPARSSPQRPQPSPGPRGLLRPSGRDRR